MLKEMDTPEITTAPSTPGPERPSPFSAELTDLQRSYSSFKGRINPLRVQLRQANPADRTVIEGDVQKLQEAAQRVMGEAKSKGFLDQTEDLAEYAVGKAAPEGAGQPVTIDPQKEHQIADMLIRDINRPELARDYFSQRLGLPENQPSEWTFDNKKFLYDPESQRWLVEQRGGAPIDDLDREYNDLQIEYNRLSSELATVSKDPTRFSERLVLESQIGVVHSQQAQKIKDAKALGLAVFNRADLDDLAGKWLDARMGRPVSSAELGRVMDTLNARGVHGGYLEDKIQTLLMEEERKARTAGMSGGGGPENYLQLDPGIATEVANIRIPGYAGRVYQEILIPESAEEKWKYLDRALVLLEQSPTEATGSDAQEAIELAQALILAIQTPAYKRVKEKLARGGNIEAKKALEMGPRLTAEFVARNKLHKGYLAFERAGDIKAVAEVVKGFNSQDLNYLIGKDAFKKTPEDPTRPGEPTNSLAGEALTLYDDPDFAKLILERYRSPELTEPIRKKIREALKDKFGGDQKDYLGVQMIAEHLWYMTGRFAKHDPNLDYNYTLSGGPWALRRILNYEGWIKRGEDAQYFFPELLFPNDASGNPIKGRQLDIDQGNFFDKQLVSNIFDYFIMQGISPDVAVGRVKQVTGVSGGFKYKDGKPEWDGPKEKEKKEVNLKLVRFGGIDFAAFQAAQPLGYWSQYNVEYQEEVRTALIATDGLLRDPSHESLFKLKGVLVHLQNSQWAEYQKLLINTVNFLKNDNRTRRHNPNITLTKADEILHMALNSGFIKPEQRSEAEDKILGWSKNFIRLNYIFDFKQFLQGILGQFLKEILKFGQS